MLLSEMTKEQLVEFKDKVQAEYDDFKGKGLSVFWIIEKITATK